MICKKCGRKLVDGESCSCGKQEHSVQRTKKFNISVTRAGLKFSGLMSVLLATFPMLSFFGDWYSRYVGGEFLGKYGVLTSGIGDIHATFTVAKVFAFVSLVLYFLLLFTRIFDVKDMDNNINVAVIVDMAFYATLVMSLFFGFVGCIAGDVPSEWGGSSVTMSVTWYAVLIMTIIGTANSFNPKFLKSLFTKSLMNEKR